MRGRFDQLLHVNLRAAFIVAWRDHAVGSRAVESVAHDFLFLCSEMASSMTGFVLLIDGGCNLYPLD
jgi:enoyl-[acyl-carrier-protein] reductase (NADH)